jgi:adenosine deaminase
VAALTEHPLPRMLTVGLQVTLNTDDPSICRINLSGEYQVAHEELGISLETLRTLVLNAVRGSFLPEEKRLALTGKLEREFSAFFNSLV